MYEGIYNTCDCKDSSYNGTNVYQELKNVFFRVGVVNRYWRYLIVEKDEIFSIVIVNLIGCSQLECLCCE